MAHLPSYKQAIDGPGIPLLISGYLCTAELLVCARVNKEWHSIFNPLVWEDPMGIIAKQSNPFRNSYQFLTQLSALAKDSAERTCDLITTLDFRPILSLRHLIQHHRQYSDYENLLTTQLVSKTSYAHLRNIRFVIFEGLKMEEYKPPFVLENSPLQYLMDSLQFRKILAVSVHGMQQLDPTWLVEFPYLVYLDISYTARAENFARWFNTNFFRFLRVLKMRGLRLTDNLVPSLVYSTDRKLWSLDLRDNFLTDLTVHHLLHSSFQPQVPVRDGPHSRFSSEDLFSHPPEYERPQHFAVDNSTAMSKFLAKDRSDTLSDITSYLKSTGNLLKTSPVLDKDDALNQPTGLTHLYISGNKLTNPSAELLLSQNRLLVLDIGPIELPPPQEYQLPYTTALGTADASAIAFDFKCRLKVLRIHHSIVTSIPTILPSSSSSSSPQRYQKHHLHHSELIIPKYINELGPFMPEKNHGIENLTLTHLPKTSYGPTIERLIAFLDACAQQEALLKKTKEGMVGGRRKPEVLPGLKVLRLEFLRLDLKAGAGVMATSGDEDVERFLAESEGDFSFFEDMGLSKDDGKEKGEGGKRFEPKEEEKDVVECLKRYRVENKGKWSGKLEIVFM